MDDKLARFWLLLYAIAIAGAWVYIALRDGQPVVSVAQASPKVETFVPEVPPETCHNPETPCSGDPLVWGDSMAWAWGGNSHDSCPPFVGYPKQSVWAFQKACREFNARTLAEANKSKRVILVASWLAYPLTDVAGGLEATLSELRGEVTVVGPTPKLRDVMSKCMRDPAACAVPRSEFDAQAEPVRKVLREVSARHGARYIEPVDYFCNATSCPALRDGVPMYWDDKHVTARTIRAWSVHDGFDGAPQP